MKQGFHFSGFVLAREFNYMRKRFFFRETVKKLKFIFNLPQKLWQMKCKYLLIVKSIFYSFSIRTREKDFFGFDDAYRKSWALKWRKYLCTNVWKAFILWREFSIFTTTVERKSERLKFSFSANESSESPLFMTHSFIATRRRLLGLICSFEFWNSTMGIFYLTFY